MKKLIFILLFALFLPFSAHPFWIWSGKSKTLKDHDITAKLGPAFRLQDGIKQLEKKNYIKAKKIFQSLIKKYPDAFEAAEAQYYTGRCLEDMQHYYEAFKAYQKVIDSYPNSKRINDLIAREYNIGEKLMNEDIKSILGFKKYDFVEHPSIEIFKSISDKTANLEYAAHSQYQLGILFMKLKRYDEAKESFGKVIDKYPDSQWLAPAKYQLAQATAKGFSGTDYDATAVTEAASRLGEFVSSHPDSDVTSQAQNQLNDLNNEEAKKNYEIGLFYERQKKYSAAKIYYSQAADKNFDTEYGKKSAEALERIGKYL